MVWIGQLPDDAMPKAVTDFKPEIQRIRVPGRLGAKLSTRSAIVLGFGEEAPKLRTRKPAVIKLITWCSQWQLGDPSDRRLALQQGALG